MNVTLDHDYASSSGTGGYSDLTANTTMLQMDAPLYDGRMFLRTDVVNMQEGSFKGGAYKEKFGTCYVNGCKPGNSQNSTGASLSAGWKMTIGKGISVPPQWASTWWTGSVG